MRLDKSDREAIEFAKMQQSAYSCAGMLLILFFVAYGILHLSRKESCYRGSGLTPTPADGVSITNSPRAGAVAACFCRRINLAGRFARLSRQPTALDTGEMPLSRTWRTIIEYEGRD